MRHGSRIKMFLIAHPANIYWLPLRYVRPRHKRSVSEHLAISRCEVLQIQAGHIVIVASDWHLSTLAKIKTYSVPSSVRIALAIVLAWWFMRGSDSASIITRARASVPE